MLGLILFGAVWLVAIAPVVLVFLLLGTAWAGVAAMLCLLLLAVRPVLRAGGLSAVLGAAGLVAVIAMAASALGFGRLNLETRVGELRDVSENAIAVEIEDRDGNWLGVLPQSLMPAAARQMPHLAVPIPAAETPPLWWRCARHLEDRRIEEPWHVDGIDFVGLVRAYIGRITGRSHEGGSTIAQMVDAGLRGVSPDPAAGVLAQLPRKWRTWSDGPAITRLYPDTASLAAAAATHIVLATGEGGDIHGVALASRALFGTPYRELDAAQQFLLAAAIWRPIRLVAGAAPPSKRNRFERLKHRAGRCLPLIDDAGERRSASERLAGLVLPLSPSAASQEAGAPGLTTASPASRATRLAGPALRELPYEVARELGPEWHRRVARVRLTVPTAAATVEAAVTAAAQRAERALGSRLQVPIWSGDQKADSIAAIANSNGEILSFAANRDGGLALAGPQPVGSLAKIAAALALGRTDRPEDRYCVGPGCRACDIFARSLAKPLEKRLRGITEKEVADAVGALGWHVPAGESARRHAVYGGLEETPATVLRAIGAVTGNLADRSDSVPLPHIVRTMQLRDGQSIVPHPTALPAEPLATAFSGPVRPFVAAVLAAPVEQPGGTAHALLPVLSQPGIAMRWAKTGTANAAGDGNLTRTVWVAGGFVYRGEPLAFLVMVAAPSNRAPLGHVEARDVAVPLAAALLSTTLSSLPVEDSKP